MSEGLSSWGAVFFLICEMIQQAVLRQ